MNNRAYEIINFEDVVMKIATRLINIPIDEFHSRIDEAMEMMGRFLDVDRVYVFDYDFENQVTNNLFEWCMDGVEPQIDFLQNIPISEILEEWVSSHKSNQMVIHEDVMALDPTNKVYQILEPQGVLSICTVPLIYKDECYGFVGFDDVRHKRMWQDDEFKLLTVFAEMMVNAIIKEKTDLRMIDLKEKAQEASEAKGVFLAQMSHEIRTPLNGVYNAFYLLSQTLRSNDHRSYLEIAQTSLDALSSIVNNILDLSKIEAGKMDVRLEQVDFEHEITKTIRTIRPSIKGKKLECLFEYDYSLNKYVMIDMKKVNQIILNLVNNSIKFTDHGYIKMSVMYHHGDSEVIELKIQDTGIGMNEEDQKRVFESFYQASNSKSTGTGLGLSIIYQLVQMMKGTIEIESELHKGTTITVRLPIETTGEIQYKVPDKSVLLLGKDPFHMHNIKRMLESLNRNVSVGLPSDDNKFDIIIIDDDTTHEIHTKSIVERLSHENSVTVLVTKNQQPSDYTHITLEFPISRHMMIQRLRQHFNEVSIINEDIEIFEGHVLIVDDNEINLEALKAILMMHGLTSDLAASGKEALEKFANHKYDLVFMDIQMPHMDGYEVSNRMKKIDHKHEVPIIAVTANVFLSAYDVKMIDAIDDVIYKPVQINHLIKIMKKYLKHQVKMFVPESLQVIRKDVFQMYFSESKEAGKTLINHFLNSFEKDYQEMIELIQSSLYQKAYQKIHYFKGPLSYMGAERVLYILAEFMMMMQGHKDVSMNDLILLEDELKILIEALYSWRE